MSATIETTIVRLHRSGFPPAKIAKLVRRSPATVRRHLPPADQSDADFSWLPTAATKAMARQIVRARQDRTKRAAGRVEDYSDDEVRLIRLLVGAGWTIGQLAEGLSRLGAKRTKDSIAGAGQRYGIRLNHKAPGPNPGVRRGVRE